MRTLLKVDNLSLAIDDKEILQNISFKIKEGEIVTIIGPNGSGKSSLLKCIIGLIDNFQGNISKEKDLIIGYMPQKIHINDNLPLTVANFLELSIGKKVDSKNIVQVAELTGIEKILNSPMQKISGGEMQFVLLAKALLKKPNLLILDEPTQGIDVRGQVSFYKLLEELRKSKNITCLMVSHDLHIVMKTTDYVICLNGHICCQGSVKTINEHEEFQNLFSIDSLHNFSVYKHHHDHDHNNLKNFTEK